MENIWSRYGGLAALGVLVAVLPAVLANNYHYDVAVNAMLNATVCVGLNLLIGYTGQISLGHAGFFALGAYGSAILTSRYGLPALPALVVAAIGVGFLAYVVGRPILKLKGHYLAMATLGFGVIIYIVLKTEAWLTGGPDGLTVPGFRIFDYRIRGDRMWYWVAGPLLLVSVWLALNLVSSPIGRALRAVHTSEVGAEVVGVRTAHYKVLVFVVSAVFASIVGSVFAHKSGFITPEISGFMFSVIFVAMVVVGGMASIYGSVIGAVLLTLLPQLLVSFDNFEHVLLGAIMMATMIFLPKGIVPSLAMLVNKMRQRQ